MYRKRPQLTGSLTYFNQISFYTPFTSWVVSISSILYMFRIFLNSIIALQTPREGLFGRGRRIISLESVLVIRPGNTDIVDSRNLWVVI